ncbi:MAG: sigma-54-dependent Fis family transcriptional regulator [Candidatus Eisenbacteria sp.]|nr:sigma-54-dependent Fis family transcriptional regulator [Candidatus Eisenbacteria bacterium]
MDLKREREWADYRPLVECYLSAGEFSMARTIAGRLVHALEKGELEWHAHDEIECRIFWAEAVLRSRSPDSLGTDTDVPAAQGCCGALPDQLESTQVWPDECAPAETVPDVAGCICALPDDGLGFVEVLVDAFRAPRLCNGLPVHLRQRIALLDCLLCERMERHSAAVAGAECAVSTLSAGCDPAVMARLLLVAGHSAASLGRDRAAEGYLRKALGSAIQASCPQLHAEVLADLGLHMSRCGQLKEAGPLVLAALEIQVRCGQPHRAAATRLELARLRRREGFLAEALELYDETIRISQLLDLGLIVLEARLEAALLRTLRFQPHEARQDLLMSIRQARRLGAAGPLIRAYGSLAVTHARALDPERAYRALSLARRVLTAAEPAVAVRAELAIHTAEVHLALGNFTDVTCQANEALSLAGQRDLLGIRAEGWLLLGKVALAERKHAEGAKVLRRAIECFTAMQDACGLGRAEVALGRALIASAPGSQERASGWHIQARGARRLHRAGVASGLSVPYQGKDSHDGPTEGRRRTYAQQRTDGPACWARYGIITRNRVLHTELLHASRVAPTALPILIYGETGSGKELAAKAIHRMSAREGRLIVFNAGTCRNELFESELFGHRKGAFTGAHRDREGLIAQAEGGTLFLDEIADLSPTAQAILLRFLDSGEARPVGSDTIRKIRTRIVAASHRQLNRMVAGGQMRRDLFFRLAGAEVNLPPLRARRDDILLLIRYFTRRSGLPLGKLEAVLSAGFSERLISYPWPGNIRQLSHWVDQLAALASGNLPEPQIIRTLERTMAAAMRLHDSDGRTCGSFFRATASPSRETLIKMLVSRKGNISKVAQDLHTYRTHVYRLLQKRGIDINCYRLNDNKDSLTTCSSNRDAVGES